MTIRTLLLLAALLGSTPALAQTAAPATPTPDAATAPTPAPAPVHALQHVRLATTAGDIILALEIERAPVSAGNFLRYVDQRRLDGTTFYRAMDLGRGYGLVQGGTRNSPARILRPVPHEPTTRTGLSHVDGAISLARGAPGTATADFFITIGDLPAYDAHPDRPGDSAGFAVFGRVVAGMDVVRQILTAPTNPNQGVGVMRGQMLARPIVITTARRVPPPAPVTVPATPAAPPAG